MSHYKPPRYLYLTDGGPLEDLGIVQLLRRHQKWILSIDVGDDPECQLLDLRMAIKLAREEKICSFYDLEDPRRDLDDVLRQYIIGTNSDGLLAPFLRLGVLYSKTGTVGEIFLRMRLLR